MKSPGTKGSLPLRTGQRPRPIAELQEQIGRRAHELYEQRGKEEGHALDDWLRAEAELTGQRAKTATASS